MKHLIRTFLVATLILIGSLAFVGCDTLLDVDSERVVLDDQYDLKAANDSLYALFGLMYKLQDLADSYVLLGELRADLMDVTETSDPYLMEINALNISPENPYTDNLTSYYALINQCNYIIQKVDTSVVRYTYKVNKRMMAVAKGIRAWVYMQLALNYGEVVYYEQPILDVKQAEKSYPVLTFDELAPKLIADLLPFRDVERLSPGFIDQFNANNAQFPIDMLLGELYLWTNQYEKAAEAYYRVMEQGALLTSSYVSALEVYSSAFTGRLSAVSWVDQFSPYTGTALTYIGASNKHQRVFHLDSLCYKYELKGSDVAYNLWRSQRYYYAPAVDTMADLRIYGSLSSYPIGLVIPMDESDDRYIYKYLYMNSLEESETRLIGIYRVSHLYLRYAEAVNRLGKPNLAMAVLKYGLNNATLSNPALVPAAEVPRPLPAYMDFSDTKYNANIGVRTRGCGQPRYDTLKCVIPALPTLTDSILAMEDLLIEELALETAFEGNRFHDLMRFALRRDDNHVLADRVAAKHKNNSEAIRTKLMDRRNWYLSH